MLFNYNIINNSCYSIINKSPGTPAPPTGHHFPAHNFDRFLLYLRWCLFQGPTERTTHSCLTLPKADPTGPTASFPLSSISQLTTLAEYFCYTGVHFKLRILETKHIPRNQDTRQVFGNPEAPLASKTPEVLQSAQAPAENLTRQEDSSVTRHLAT